MKSKLIFIAIFILPLSSYAQFWYVGAKSGVALSNYKSATPWKEAVNTGFAAGVSAFKQIENNFGLGIEMQYIQKGYYHKVCNTISDRLQADYLEIPVMADYTFLIPGIKNLKGHVNGGVYTAYWMRARYRMKGFDSKSDTWDFSTNHARRFDFGPLAGGRVEYVLRSGSLSLDFRYELGVLDMQKNITESFANTNRTFLIGINYMKVLNF